MKRHLLLSTILGISLTGACDGGHGGSGRQAAETQGFSFWLLDSIVTLDPQLVESVEDSDVVRQLFEGLYTESASGELVPAGALSYDLSEDKMTYTFHLRPETKWSNGDPVTANDYVYAWQRLVDPATASAYGWYGELMQIVGATEVLAGEKPVTDLGVKALDDLTLEVKLITPLPYFVKMTVHSSVLPVHKATIDAFGQKWTEPAIWWATAPIP